MTNPELTLRLTEHGYDQILTALNQANWDGETEICIRRRKKGGLSGSQRGALHLWLEQMAEGMNDAGYSVQEVFTLPVKITKDVLKENLFKVYMRKMYPERESTEDLRPMELTDIYETVNAVIAEKYGVSLPFPSQTL